VIHSCIGDSAQQADHAVFRKNLPVQIKQFSDGRIQAVNAFREAAAVETGFSELLVREGEQRTGHDSRQGNFIGRIADQSGDGQNIPAEVRLVETFPGVDVIGDMIPFKLAAQDNLVAMAAGKNREVAEAEPAAAFLNHFADCAGDKRRFVILDFPGR
jgi:hypothetical protein